MNASEIRITFRLPDDLHAKVQASAAKNWRSLNAEIVAIISGALDDQRDINQRVEALEAAVFGQREDITHEG